MKIEIVNLTKRHWEDVKRICLEGIESGDATFETSCPDWDDWNLNHLKLCRFIAKSNDKILGWAALSSISNRCVYSGAAEVSIYVDRNYRGRGVGCKLLDKLIKESEKRNFWTLQAGIFPENLPSIHLHKKLGFRQIGIREKIGKMNGQWRDVALLERRSKIV